MKLPMPFVDTLPPDVKDEIENRIAELAGFANFDDLSNLEKKQVQMGTTVPMLYNSFARFVANPSTISVETFKRMLDTDEMLNSGINFINLAMIARFGEYRHPNADIQKFVRRAIEQMEGSWHENLDEMFSAEYNGFSITEPVWQFLEDFDGAPAFVPKKLATYPALTFVFAVDQNGEVLPDGIYQYQRFHNTATGSWGGLSDDMNGFRPDLYASAGDMPYPIRIASDVSYMTVKIPREKVIHLRSSMTGKQGNPYGRSVFRPLYKNWVAKDAFMKMWIVAADRKGTPLLIGYAQPNDTVQGRSSSGEFQAARADMAMAQAMSQLHNDSFVVLPGKKGEMFEVESINIQGDMNVFKDGIDYFNKAIMRGLLIPPLVMTGGDGAGSYSLGQEHHKIFTSLIDGKLKIYKQGILDQFIAPMIAYNFPRALWEKQGPGEFATDEYDPEVMEKLGNIFGNLADKGFLDASDQVDFDFVRSKVGAPKRKAPGAISYGEPEDDNTMPDLHDPSPSTTTPSAGAQPSGAEAEVATQADSAFNGAQVTAVVNVVSQVSKGEIPLQTGHEILKSMFGFTDEQAARLLPADIANTVKPTNEPPAPGGPGGLEGEDTNEVNDPHDAIGDLEQKKNENLKK